MGARWTDADDCLLTAKWGDYLAEELAALLDRTPDAVARRACLLRLPHPDSRTLSLTQAERRSGYDRRSLLRAAAYLHLELRRCRVVTPNLDTRKRVPRTTNIRRGPEYALDQRTLERLVHWLGLHPAGRRAGAAWTRDFGPDGPAPACRGCGRTGVRHAARLLCHRCYERRRYGVREEKRRVPVEQQAGRWERICPGCATIFRAENPAAKWCCQSCKVRTHKEAKR